MTEEATIRLRMSAQDAHYGGELVAGATVLALFGDVATELAVRHDGDEGLLRVYENVEFLAPVYAGDFIEATGKIVQVGNTSRKIEFVATKVISPDKASGPSAADVLAEPIVVARATGVTVVLKDRQRRTKR